MGTLKQDLGASGLDLIETHTAWVFLGADTVWKVKKPVDFGFLDFTTLERRRTACDAEIALNSRLAPDVYRGVVPITRDAAGRHGLGGTGEVVDIAVEMARLADRDRADVLLEGGQLSHEHMDRLGQTLAAFHERMPTSERIAGFGSPEMVLANIRENFAQTQHTLHEYLDVGQASEIQARQLSFVEDHRELFIARMVDGKVRDGHGDLRLEHVYLQPEPTIIDCIEFNERFRYGDVCSDVAFLTMDLACAGRVDLSEQLLAAYASAANDFDLYQLVDFYEGYRAFVRGKVASLLVDDADASVQARRRAAELARRHYLFALASGRASVTPPVMLAVGGIVGAGKSTLATQLGATLTAPVVGTDRTRKHWLGVTSTTSLSEPVWAGAYSSKVSERIYGEVLRRAACVLRSGRPVIVDGSFRSRAERGRARLLAQQLGVPFLFVECRATPEDCRARLRRRTQQAHVSDARVELFDDFVKHFEPIDELGPQEHVVVDTSGPAPEASRALEPSSKAAPVSPDALRELRSLLPAWPAGH